MTATTEGNQMKELIFPCKGDPKQVKTTNKEEKDVIDVAIVNTDTMVKGGVS